MSKQKTTGRTRRVPEADNDQSTFAARIRYLLRMKHISQNEFARQLGCTSAYISNVTQGKTKPGLGILEAIASKFEVDLNWLVTGKTAFANNAEINPHWFQAILFRSELARLASLGDTEAKVLVEEILAENVDTANESPGRKVLLAELSRSSRTALAALKLYAEFPSTQTHDPSIMKQITISAVRHFSIDALDPVSALVNSGTRQVRDTDL